MKTPGNAGRFRFRRVELARLLFASTPRNKNSRASSTLRKVGGAGDGTCPPVRVILDAIRQSGTQWIGDDVPGLSDQVLIRAQPVFVIAALPDRCGAADQWPDRASAARLESLHSRSERSAAKLEQPMQVIRHQYPGFRADPSFRFKGKDFSTDDCCDCSVGEQRFALGSHGGHGVPGQRLGMAADQKAWAGHVRIMEIRPACPPSENSEFRMGIPPL